jgi:NAD(P)-dependent dehydrogenase (short-subunit alcohol dehydrogenase family)
MADSYLVTGASTGLGRSVVRRLVGMGCAVWAGVRSADAEADLRSEFGPAVRLLRFDVTDDAAVAAAGEEVAAAGPLTGVVNNAGAALPGPLEFMPLDVFRQQLEVNVVGQLAVTQAMLPALRAARARGGQARVVTVGSIGGRIAGPMLGAYHTSKFAITGLTDALRAELAPWGIDVVLVEPGAIATPIWQRGLSAADELMAGLPERVHVLYDRQIARARANAERSAQRGLDPDRAARAVVDVVTAHRARPRVLIGRDALVAAVVARTPFRLRYRLTAARP